MATKKITKASAKSRKKAAGTGPAKKARLGRAVSAEAPPKKLSALDAAARVLAERKQAMNCAELIQVMAAKGYWKSPAGKTPAATLYAALAHEIKTRGEQARFRKAGPGQFARA